MFYTRFSAYLKDFDDESAMFWEYPLWKIYQYFLQKINNFSYKASLMKRDYPGNLVKHFKIIFLEHSQMVVPIEDNSSTATTKTNFSQKMKCLQKVIKIGWRWILFVIFHFRFYFYFPFSF